MSSLRDKSLNVGGELRPTSEINSDATSVFVASYLACLCVFLSASRMRQAGARRQVCLGGVVSPFRIYYTPQVTSNAAKLYIKL